MKVHGHEITQEMIDACVARMKREPFKTLDIEAVLLQTEFCGDSMRAADRIIQKFRKGGKIDYGHHVGLRSQWWKWIGE